MKIPRLWDAQSGSERKTERKLHLAGLLNSAQEAGEVVRTGDGRGGQESPGMSSPTVKASNKHTRRWSMLV